MLHEERSSLSKETQDMKRAIDSLREEFEAIDWYRQRADACSDKELRAILEHNMREEQEHAMMLLEWIRRADAHMAEMVDEYIKADGPIVAKEKESKK